MLLGRRPIGTLGVMSGTMAVMEDFMWSLVQTVQFNSEFLCQSNEYVHLMKPSTSFHPSARNQLAAGFLGEWVLMLDNDHAFDPDLVARMVILMKQFDLDVLSGLYRYRVHPYLPVAFYWNEETQGFVNIAELDWNAMLREIPCVGAGCLLVRRRVFDRIRSELHEAPFDIIHPLSEDFSFFTRLRRLGIKAHISPLIESYHLRVHKVSNADYDRDAVVTSPIPSGGEIVAGKR